MTKTRRLLVALIALAMLHGASMVGAPQVASAGGSTGSTNSFNFTGSGWGHGVGMSQWGARGLAEQGRSASQILTHYYSGTTVAPTAVTNDLRVLIGQKLSSIDVGVWGTVAVKHGSTTLGTASGWFKATRSGNNVALTGAINATAPDEVVIALTAPTRVEQTGHVYARGSLRIAIDPAGGLRMTVFGLTMDDYLLGLGEMSVVWPAEAQRAQAIAGRTFAQKVVESQNRAASDHDLLDGTIHQSYNGSDIETATYGERWVHAVTSTSGQAVKYGSELIHAVYSASSGGHTENSETVWVTPLPYLRGVPDPADAVAGNPHNAWSRSYTGSSLGAALGIGTVTRVDVGSGGGVSGRLDKVKLKFFTAGGVAEFTGVQVKSKLGLQSTKFKVNGIGEPVGNTTTARGSLETVDLWTGNPDSIIVGGKASDPDGPIRVIIADQGPEGIRFHETRDADGNFLTTFKTSKGDHTICVALLDNPTGESVQLGCRNVVVK